jgi:NAD(P)-dependent dehydrogenase (short-subunit alcohol dehydrogenase family)
VDLRATTALVTGANRGFGRALAAELVSAATGDVSLLVNNAGIDTRSNLLTADLAEVQAELDTHYLGSLSVVRAFLPQVERAGGTIEADNTEIVADEVSRQVQVGLAGGVAALYPQLTR